VIQKYVILRAPAPPIRESGSLFSKSANGDSEPPARGPIVETQELSERDAEGLSRDRGVSAAAPVVEMVLHQPRTVDAADTPDERDVTWGLRAVGGDASPYDGRGVTVAVLDTGIDRNHETFIGSGVDIVEKDFTGEGNGDWNGHGTHCAGTIFGQSAAPRIGVAPGITRALVGKVLDQNGFGTTESIVAGVQWALTEGAHVISMSLGIDFSRMVERLRASGMPSQAATSMGLEAYRTNLVLFSKLGSFVHGRDSHFQPTVLVAATGNESERPSFTIAAGPPAAGENVLAVGALGRTAAGLAIASFSNSRARVSAPGVAVLSARRGGGLGVMSGTSMATPHVAGVAALWADALTRKFGRFDAMSLMGKIVGSTVTKPLAPGFSSVDGGLGIVQAPQD
jgi:subtilisin family serine protease